MSAPARCNTYFFFFSPLPMKSEISREVWCLLILVLAAASNQAAYRHSTEKCTRRSAHPRAETWNEKCLNPFLSSLSWAAPFSARYASFSFFFFFYFFHRVAESNQPPSHRERERERERGESSTRAFNFVISSHAALRLMPPAIATR